MITIALSKGRIFDETLPLLEQAGIRPLEDPEASRKLIIGTTRAEVLLFPHLLFRQLQTIQRALAG